MSDVSVVRPEEADLPAMELVYVASLRRNVDGFIQDLAYHENVKDFARRMVREGGDFAVAKLDGRVVGLAGLKKMGDGVMELGKLHVDADVHGRGVGRALLGHLEARARELGTVRLNLDVTAPQVAAISLYKKSGFVVDREAVWEGMAGGERVRFEVVWMHKDL